MNCTNKIIYFLLILFTLTSCKYKKQVELFDHNGKVFREYYTNKKLKNGVFKEYFEDGNLFVKTSYLNDSIDGEYIEYYKNGQLKYHLIYSKNRLMEITEYYDKFGNELDFGKIKDGNGVVKIYNNSGKLRRVGALKNGLCEGYWYNYRNAGFMDSILFVHGYVSGSKILHYLP